MSQVRSKKRQTLREEVVTLWTDETRRGDKRIESEGKTSVRRFRRPRGGKSEGSVSETRIIERFLFCLSIRPIDRRSRKHTVIKLRDVTPSKLTYICRPRKVEKK